MSIRDGKAYCDKCDGHLENDNILNAVLVSAVDDQNRVQNFHFCLVKSDELKRCAPSVFTKTALAGLNKHRDEPLRLHVPATDDGTDGQAAATPSRKRSRKGK